MPNTEVRILPNIGMTGHGEKDREDGPGPSQMSAVGRIESPDHSRQTNLAAPNTTKYP